VARNLASPWTFKVGSAAAVFAIAVLAAACSSAGTAKPTSAISSSSSGSSAVAACQANAKAILKPWQTLPTTLPAGLTPLSEPPPKGGTIIKMTLAGLPADQTVFQGIQQAAAAIGWTAKQISWNGTIQDLNSKMMQAVSEKPTIIALSSQPTAALQQPLKAAKAAGVVVEVEGADRPPITYPGYAATSLTDVTFDTMSQVMAAWVANDSACTAHVAYVTLQGIAPQEYSANTFKSGLAKLCPNCKSTIYQVQESEIGSPALLLFKRTRPPSMSRSVWAISSMACPRRSIRPGCPE
jgi:hypothetical protein